MPINHRVDHADGKSRVVEVAVNFWLVNFDGIDSKETVLLAHKMIDRQVGKDPPEVQGSCCIEGHH